MSTLVVRGFPTIPQSIFRWLLVLKLTYLPLHSLDTLSAGALANVAHTCVPGSPTAAQRLMRRLTKAFFCRRR